MERSQKLLVAMQGKGVFVVDLEKEILRSYQGSVVNGRDLTAY